MAMAALLVSLLKGLIMRLATGLLNFKQDFG
jgi:hypothetical protein